MTLSLMARSRPLCLACLVTLSLFTQTPLFAKTEAITLEQPLRLLGPLSEQRRVDDTIFDESWSNPYPTTGPFNIMFQEKMSRDDVYVQWESVFGHIYTGVNKLCLNTLRLEKR